MKKHGFLSFLRGHKSVLNHDYAALVIGGGSKVLLRRLTDRLIPDDAGFLFAFKAWNPRIASYVRVSTTQKTGKKTSSGGMRLFGNRLSINVLAIDAF